VTGNIAKWVAELVEFELDFVPRHAVKSQVLADFIVDWTPSASLLGGPDDSEPEPRACPTLGLTTFWNTLGRGNHVNNILVYSVGRFTITKCLVMKNAQDRFTCSIEGSGFHSEETMEESMQGVVDKGSLILIPPRGFPAALLVFF
jgi:hypothetical protein